MKTQLSKRLAAMRDTLRNTRGSAGVMAYSGRSAAKVAAELGIRAPLFYRWARPKHQANLSGNESKSGRSVEELEAEIRRLRAENAKLLEQREVLKKSLGILSEAAERYARIEQMSGQYKTAWLCESAPGLAQWLLRLDQTPSIPGSAPTGEHALT